MTGTVGVRHPPIAPVRRGLAPNGRCGGQRGRATSDTVRMKVIILSYASCFAISGAANAQRSAWTVGPSYDDPMHATVSTHAEADIDGDGRPDVLADCSLNSFGVIDNSWPKIEGRVHATLMVGARSYDVEASML